MQLARGIENTVAIEVGTIKRVDVDQDPGVGTGLGARRKRSIRLGGSAYTLGSIEQHEGS